MPNIADLFHEENAPTKKDGDKKSIEKIKKSNMANGPSSDGLRRGGLKD